MEPPISDNSTLNSPRFDAESCTNDQIASNSKTASGNPMTNLTTYKLFDDSIRQVEAVFARYIEPLLQQEYEIIGLHERLEKLHAERVEYNSMLRAKHAKIVENIEAYLVSLTKPVNRTSFNQKSG